MVVQLGEELLHAPITDIICNLTDIEVVRHTREILHDLWNTTLLRDHVITNVGRTVRQELHEVLNIGSTSILLGWFRLQDQALGSMPLGLVVPPSATTQT